jgi:hypothetical protein
MINTAIHPSSATGVNRSQIDHPVCKSANVMMVCVSYSVHRGNDLENAEWIGDKLRGLPARLQPTAQDYDIDRSAGWLLLPNLEQAVWFLQEYGASRRVSYLWPRAVAVSPAADMPGDLDSLMVWLDDLAFARTVLGAEQDDRFYLVHPEARLGDAIDVALIARYAKRGRARLLPTMKSTDWDTADDSWERRLLPARIPEDRMLSARVPEEAMDLAALRTLVERLRAEAPRQVDLICDELPPPQAGRLAHLLVLTQGLVPRVLANGGSAVG